MVTAALMASVVFTVGITMEPPTRPIVLPAGAIEATDDGSGTCLESPVGSVAEIGITGHGTICDDDRGIRATLRVSGLTQGDRYAAWLSYAHQALLCRHTPCRQIDLLNDGPAGLLMRIEEGVASPSQTLEFHGELRGMRLMSGGEISLLLRSQGQPAPRAQAVFRIP
jgi:hypothetical protein